LVYEYNNFVYIHDYGKARLYKGKHLIFKGNAWTGILMFLSHTDNAPEVREMFKAQIDQREKPRFSNTATKSENRETREQYIARLQKEKEKITRPPKEVNTKKKSIWDEDRRLTK
tara:strand:+ start:668 stop:1012 length:345 start_codon:yes stop_codon:yes gene_type:complete